MRDNKVFLLWCTWTESDYMNLLIRKGYRYIDIYRELKMIYRGPGMFTVVWFGSSPPSPVSKSSLFLSLLVCCWSSSLIGEGRGVGFPTEFRSQRVSRNRAEMIVVITLNNVVIFTKILFHWNSHFLETEQNENETKLCKIRHCDETGW